MNFFTADVAIVVNAKGVPAELAKIKAAATKTATKVQKSFDKMSARIMKTIKRAAKYVAAAFVAMGAAAVKWAADVQESEHLFEFAMGDMADATKEWSEELADSLKRNQYEIRRTVASLTVLMTTMGFTSTEAAGMSRNLIQFSYDMAALRNMRPEEVFEKLKSGIVGFSRPMRALGISTIDASVKMYALEHSIGSATGELSELEKMTARYGIMMETAAEITGYARSEVDYAAQVWMQLRDQIKLTAIELGKRLLPEITDVGIAIREWFIDNRDKIVDALTAIASVIISLADVAWALKEAIIAVGIASLLYAKAGAIAYTIQTISIKWARLVLIMQNVRGQMLDIGIAQMSLRAGFSKMGKVLLGTAGMWIALAAAIGIAIKNTVGAVKELSLLGDTFDDLGEDLTKIEGKGFWEKFTVFLAQIREANTELGKFKESLGPFGPFGGAGALGAPAIPTPTTLPTPPLPPREFFFDLEKGPERARIAIEQLTEAGQKVPEWLERIHSGYEENARVLQGFNDTLAKFNALIEIGETARSKRLKGEAEEATAMGLKWDYQRKEAEEYHLDTASLAKEAVEKAIAAAEEEVDAVRYMHWMTRMEKIQYLQDYLASYKGTAREIAEIEEILQDEILRLNRSRVDSMEVWRAEHREDMADDSDYAARKWAEALDKIEVAGSDWLYNWATDADTALGHWEDFCNAMLSAWTRMLTDMVAKAIMTAAFEPAFDWAGAAVSAGIGGLFGGGTGGAGSFETGRSYAEPKDFQHGGTVLQTGWAKVHKGETFSGVGGGGGGNIDVRIHNEGQPAEITDIESYMISDQRIIDVTMQAAETDGGYRRSINQIRH